MEAQSLFEPPKPSVHTVHDPDYKVHFAEVRKQAENSQKGDFGGLGIADSIRDRHCLSLADSTISERMFLRVSVGGVAFRISCRGEGAIFEIAAGKKDSMRDRHPRV